MLPYWLLFLLWTAGALQAERRRVAQWQDLFFFAAAALTALMIGLRFEVGGDWNAYLRIYGDLRFLSFRDGWTITDPGYAFVNLLAQWLGFGIGFVNLICAVLFMGGVAHLAWRQPNPALTMLVAVPYLVIVVAMGYTRQAAAIGIICFAISTGSERRIVRMIVLIGIAALFHKTAILLLPVALRPILQRQLLIGLFSALVFAGLFVVLLRDTSDSLVSSYVNSSYDSQGALVRVLMNVLPAMLFFVLRRKIALSPFQYNYWMTCSVLALISLVGLLTAQASSGIDRIALYLVPLQMVVYGRLPYVLSRTGRSQPALLFAVIGYAVAVQYIWLLHADNADAWLPYQTILSG